jgi:Ser/Thr protein kinase RdoA (MazF antagonist)
MRIGYPAVRPTSVESPPELRAQADATAAHLLRELGVEAVPTPLRDGREHHLYRVHCIHGDFLLKFPRADGLPDPFEPDRPWVDRLRSESIAISLAQGVPVPSPYFFHPETWPPCSLMGILPGVSPEQQLERGRVDWVGLLGLCMQIGRMLAQIHTRRRPPNGGGLPDLPGCDPATARLLHLDFHIGNVLGRPELGWRLTGVLDWTCARWGPPEADLVELQVSLFAANPRAREAFLSGYRQVSPHIMDVEDVEARAILEIQRRLIEDPPEKQMIHIWEDWMEQKLGGLTLGRTDSLPS